MSDLRPTLFLAQLPNLLAGNISIVHGVVGSSRTFLGEESAGVDAVRIAQARIAAGQSEVTLVGGAYHGARWDICSTSNSAARCCKGKFAPVWDRGPKGGIALGNAGRIPGARKPRACASARRAAACAHFGRSAPTATGAQPGEIEATLAPRNGTRSPRRSTVRTPPSFPAPPGLSRRHRRNGAPSRNSAFPFAIPARISVMGSRPSSRPIWASAARCIEHGKLFAPAGSGDTRRKPAPTCRRSS